ncbi:MAG TPA: glucose-6-phosphate dehydrogenase, partial [Acidimicrobiia bacterium]|nr:glucose-6-phosphate dehydrogenase [Acidimicrobiia bacterium]
MVTLATGSDDDVDSVAISCALVVLGATGDLAKRKLYPALSALAERGQLPRRLVVVGVARTPMRDDEFAALMPGLPERGVAFRYVAGSFDDPSTFATLATLLESCDSGLETGGNRLYYLSTVPALFGKVAAGLGGAGLADEPSGTFRRVVIEKPFGTDLPSAQALDASLHAVFREHQIFRIDHYLAKETVQNILAVRFANS